MSITIEYRDLFGNWQATDKTYTVEAARAAALNYADATDTAYRVVVDGEPVDVIDLEAGFWELGRHQDDPESGT